MGLLNNNTSKKSWDYTSIYKFFTEEKNAKHEIFNSLICFEEKDKNPTPEQIKNAFRFNEFKRELSSFSLSDFLEQKSSMQPKKEIRYFLRKIFQNYENDFLKEKDKDRKLQMIIALKTFAKIFGTTAKVNSKLQAELDK